MANEELIRGKNLFTYPTFTTGWNRFWTATPGKHRVRKDEVTGMDYLELVDGGVATCAFPAPVRPGPDARYWFAFFYEARGAGDNTVSIQTNDGTEIFKESFVTRKAQEKTGSEEPNPLAEFRRYEPFDLSGLKREDTSLTLTVTAAGDSERNGIYITGFDMDVRLAPLELATLTLDDLPIPLSVLTPQAVS